MTVKYFKTYEEMNDYINKNGLAVIDFGLNNDWNKGKYYVTVYGNRGN